MDELRAAFKRGTFNATLHWQGAVNKERFGRMFGRLWEVHNGALRVYNIGTQRWLDVPVGSWVLRVRNGDFIVVSDEVIRLFARLR